MKVKMKRCVDCQTLCSNTSKVCIKCQGRELEKGLYSDEPRFPRITHEQIMSVQCPTCVAPIPIGNSPTGYSECLFCGELVLSNGAQY